MEITIESEKKWKKKQIFQVLPNETIDGAQRGERERERERVYTDAQSISLSCQRDYSIQLILRHPKHTLTHTHT